jgi:uncharacterized LabA/DUF88 family protein
MAKRIGVFCDVSNLYYCIGKKFGGRKLDYRKYWEYVQECGEVVEAIAYGAQVSDEAAKFMLCLKNIGFLTKFMKPKTYHNVDGIRHKADWDVGITIDIIESVERFDRIFLGSADGDLKPLVDYVQKKGVEVVVFACGISRALKDTAFKFVEIPESLLEDVVIVGDGGVEVEDTSNTIDIPTDSINQTEGTNEPDTKE